jgi:hypothetical protein
MEKLVLQGQRYTIEFVYREERYKYDDTVDHYYDVTRYVVFWSGQARLADNHLGVVSTFLFETERFNSNYIDGQFYYSDFSRVLFMCEPISGNSYRGDVVYFSLDIAVDREKTVDYLCQKVKEILDQPTEAIIRTIILPEVSLKELQTLGLATEAGGQIALVV